MQKIRNWIQKNVSTFQIIIVGFIAVILIGALILMLPFASRQEGSATFFDSLFTATSAVCVTGLVVKDTATYWTGFGQAVILSMIQIGGLGIISIAAILTVISGKKITLIQRQTMQDALSAPQVGGIVKLTLFILRVSLIIEFAGALIMLPAFCSYYGVKGIWMAFFHSVSAFCNAGFDIMGGQSGQFSSLTVFVNNPLIVIVICLLIVFGGIGFLTWEDVVTHGIHINRYKMQSKVILMTSLALILIPAIILFFTDFSSLPLGERILVSLFQSITTRTAGFNTIDLGLLSGGGRALFVVLMLIGGSPGSTAGGMKTTTFAVLLSTTQSVFLRKKNVQKYGRRIDDATIKVATSVAMMYVTTTFIATTIISLVEKVSYSTCLFEVASAIGTVGLTLGLTPSLGVLSRIILIVLMFMGRVGGLTIIYAALSSSKVPDINQYPIEKITVG